VSFEPSVSIVITCYNHGRFLGEAIESARAQTLSPIEIIVIDDGSTDDSFAVAAGFKDVKCLTGGNQGLAAARNLGFNASTGPFLIFLDADDRLMPAAVEAGLSALAAHPECGFVSGHYAVIDSQGVQLHLQQTPCDAEADYGSLLRRNHIGMHAAVMYRRAVVERAGGFNASLRACEDYDLYLRAARIFSYRCHHQPVAEYRQHESNMSNDAALMLDAALSVVWSQRSYVRKNPRYREAYREGVRHWSDYYGRRLEKQIAASARALDWRKVAASALVLLRLDPARFLQMTRRAFASPPQSAGTLLSGTDRSNDTNTGIARTEVDTASTKKGLPWEQNSKYQL
jgi:glycosyltransferase involved in cell wall biosynthesis